MSGKCRSVTCRYGEKTFDQLFVRQSAPQVQGLFIREFDTRDIYVYMCVCIEREREREIGMG